MNDDIRSVCFGRFTFDLVTLELTRDGRPVALAPQPARVLAALVRNAGRLVTRDELKAILWADSVVDYEKGLNTAVRQARDALGDHASTPEFIETLPRRGYRFIAEVTAHSSPPAPPLLTTTAAEGGRDEPDVHRRGARAISPRPARLAERRWVGARIWLGVIATVIAVVFLAPIVARRMTGGESEVVRLLILPFANLTADPENDAVVDGLTEDLRSYLSAMAPGRLIILGRTTAERYRSVGMNRSRIRDEFDVDYVLDGRVLADEDGLRVLSQLVSSGEDRPVWEGEYDVPVYEGLPWGREIGRRVAAFLDLEADPVSGEPARVMPSADGRLSYLKARYLLGRPGRDAAARAADQFAETLSADSAFAPAWSGLAEATLRMGDLELARRAAVRALGLDPRLGEAHRVLGAVLMVGDRDLDSARPHFERAAAAPSASPEDHQAYAFYLFLTGQPKAGIEEAEAAYGLDPLSSALNGDVGVYYLWAGEPERALERCSLAAELDPQHVWAYRCLVTALEMMEREEDARPHLRHLMLLEGADSAAVRSVTTQPPAAMLSAYRQWRIGRLEARSAPSGADRFALARLYASEGLIDRAIASLEAAASDPPLGFATISLDPAFHPLAKEPRFRRLLDDLWLE